MAGGSFGSRPIAPTFLPRRWKRFAYVVIPLVTYFGGFYLFAHHEYRRATMDNDTIQVCAVFWPIAAPFILLDQTAHDLAQRR